MQLAALLINKYESMKPNSAKTTETNHSDTPNNNQKN